MKVCIDPGHGPGCVNGGYGYLEHEGMWKLSNYLKAALERCNIETILTRTANEDPSLTVRGKKAKGFDLFISEHSNAGGGKANGVEIYYSVQVPLDEKLAYTISKAESTAMSNDLRGAKTKHSTGSSSEDYYTVIYAARNVGCPHVLLAENGFHDNMTDATFLKVDENLKLLAELQCENICVFFNLEYKTEYPTPSDPIPGYKKIIQSKCNFSDPEGIWAIVNTHKYAKDWYKLWAESYKL